MYDSRLHERPGTLHMICDHVHNKEASIQKHILHGFKIYSVENGQALSSGSYEPRLLGNYQQANLCGSK